MKLRLPNRLKAAVMAAAAAVVYATAGTATIGAAAQATEETGKTLHVYVLTGQSNSLGAVKGDPASADTLAYYSTAKEGDGIQMWNGNMSGSVSDNAPSKNLVVSDEGKTWQTVAPQAPTLTNLCMGPEYGFAYMMQKKGWEMGAGHDVAIIKGSRDGGPNTQWDKGASLYDLLLNSVVEALKHVDQGSYDSVELNGLMYLQGESNNTAAGADGKFAAFVSNLQTDVKTKLAELAEADSSYAYLPDMVKVGGTSETLYAVAGESASWGNQGNAVTNGTAAALAGLAESSDTTGFVYTRDLDKITPGDGMGVHYDGNSEITIGARYAYAMAAEQGMDVTEGGTMRVRSQEYGDTFSAADRTPTDTAARTPLSLNEAAAWWRSADEAAAWTTADLADKVAVWDVSSANMLNTAQGAETLSDNLAVGGIRIEDPYAEDDTTGTHNATIAVRNAAGADATLTVGSKGIELQRGNLSLQTKVATDGAQTWTVAGGKTLTVAGSIGGTDTVALHKHADIDSAAAAQFDFSAATDSGHRTWDIGDGVKVTLSDTGFAQSSLAVEAAASAALAGGNAALGSLSLGNGASLDLAGGLTLSAGTLSLGNTAALTFNYSNGAFSALHADSISAGDNSAVTINLGHVASLSRAEFTLGTGWSGWSVADEAGSGKVLSLGSAAPFGYHLSVDGMGNLILSGVPVYPDVQKTWVTAPAGAVVAAANNLVAANSAQFVSGSDSTKAVLVNGAGGSSQLLYGAFKTSVGEGKSLYTEMQVANAQFISNAGTFSWTDRATALAGDYNMKIADGTTIQSVFGASNITVNGNVYTELSADNATYTNGTYGVVGAFGADVSGEVSLVINGGTFNNGVNVWGSKFNKSANNLGDLSIEVNGGSLQNIYVSDANAHTIKSATVILNGGTVNGSVYGSNTGGVTITNGTSVFIGGDAVVKGDIFGGAANALTGRVTLHDMAENAKFLTNFSSDKGIYADNIVLNDTTIGSGFNGTLHANTVTIGEGSSLVAGKLAAGAALAGSGDYKLAGGTQAMTSGVTLSDDWAGAVVISGNLNDLNLNKSNTTAQALYKDGSAIRLDGWTGYFANADQQIEANIEIGAGGANITNGWGANVQTFAGKLSGEGNITRTNASDLSPQLKFTGDVSEYTGTFINNRCHNNYGLKLTFSESANVINASFKNDKQAAGTLELHIAAADTTLNGSIVRDSNYAQNKITLTLDNTASSLTINAAAEVTALSAAGKAICLGSNGEGAGTTHGALIVAGEAALGSLNLGSGTSATFNGATTISGALTNSGLLAVNNTLNLTGGRGTAWDLGSVAGTGDIVVSSSTGNREYTLSGDLSGWTGALKQSSGSGNATLNITGTSELKADIINQAATSAACKLDINLLHDMTVTGDMSYTDKGLLNVKVGDASHQVETALESTITANSLTVTNGSTAAIGNGTVQIAGTANGDAALTLTKKEGATEAALSGAQVTTAALGTAASGSKATVTDTAVSVGNNATVAISDVVLKDSDITVAEGATAVLSNTSVEAASGATLSGVTTGENVSARVEENAALSFINQGSAIGLTNLFLGSGATMNAYTGTPTQEQIAAAQKGAAGIEANISVSGIISAGIDAKLNADLTLENGATLAFSDPDGLRMGSSLTLAEGALIHLSQDMIMSLNALIRGEELVLFSGVDGFIIDGAAYNANTVYQASSYFNLAGVNYAEHLVVKYEVPAGSVNGGVVSLYMATPEPATTSLSLLALAALAARRRRK